MPGFDQIHGQDPAVRRLNKTLSSRRQPHAFIFAGPAGVGRQTTASALAEVLLCEAPPGPTAACGRCVGCRMMQTGSHPDFQLVYKELAAYHDDPAVRNRVMQELGIEVIRQFLIAPAQQGSNRGRGKIFVVLEADLMSNAAQNALLKTLEEPPAGVRIILLTERPDQLLPTTRSRCWIVRFALLDRQFTTEQLTARGIETEEARFLAAMTGGSIGLGLQLAEMHIFQTKQELLDRLSNIGPAGDVELGDQMARITDQLANQAVAASGGDGGPELSKNLATRRAAGTLLKLMASMYSDAMHLAGQDDPSGLAPRIHADQPDAIARLARRFRPEQLAAIIEQLSRYEQLLWRNVNPKLVWDNVTITCASARRLGI